MTEYKQFKIVNDCGDYHLMDGDEQFGYDLCSYSMRKTNWNNVVNKLNEQEETIQTQKDYIIRMGHGTIFEEMKRLKERNQRQCERLKEITDLMQNRDWEALESIVEDWEQGEEQLEREWGTYGDDV